MRCKHHPAVDATKMWGCPDCIVELRHELARESKSANYWYTVALNQKAPQAREVADLHEVLEKIRKCDHIERAQQIARDALKGRGLLASAKLIGIYNVFGSDDH